MGAAGQRRRRSPSARITGPVRTCLALVLVNLVRALAVILLGAILLAILIAALVARPAQSGTETLWPQAQPSALVRELTAAELQEDLGDQESVRQALAAASYEPQKTHVTRKKDDPGPPDGELEEIKRLSSSRADAPYSQGPPENPTTKFAPSKAPKKYSSRFSRRLVTVTTTEASPSTTGYESSVTTQQQRLVRRRRLPSTERPEVPAMMTTTARIRTLDSVASNTQLLDKIRMSPDSSSPMLQRSLRKVQVSRNLNVTKPQLSTTPSAIRAKLEDELAKLRGRLQKYRIAKTSKTTSPGKRKLAKSPRPFGLTSPPRTSTTTSTTPASVTTLVPSVTESEAATLPAEPAIPDPQRLTRYRFKPKEINDLSEAAPSSDDAIAESSPAKSVRSYEVHESPNEEVTEDPTATTSLLLLLPIGQTLNSGQSLIDQTTDSSVQSKASDDPIDHHDESVSSAKKPRETEHKLETVGMVHKEASEDESQEDAKKDYAEWEEHAEGEKGHLDKEDHIQDSETKEGDKHHLEEAAGFEQSSEKGGRGEAKGEYGESARHQQGHSTKGNHVVHEKDAYEKRVEFFDESHEDDDREEDGAEESQQGSRSSHESSAGQELEGLEDHKFSESKATEDGRSHQESQGHSVDSAKSGVSEHLEREGTSAGQDYRHQRHRQDKQQDE